MYLHQKLPQFELKIVQSHYSSLKTEELLIWGLNTGERLSSLTPWFKFTRIVKMSCLCLGSPGSGKTLLLKRLQNPSVDDVTSTVETVGTNIVRVPRKPPQKDVKEGSKAKRNWDDKDVVAIREIGGSMSPLWPSYYAPNKLILYVIDSSNLFQISISTVLLMEMLTHEKLVGVKFLIVLTKNDQSNRKKMNHLKFIMRTDTILTQAGKRITFKEVSSITGDGIENVRQWLDENSKEPYYE